MVFSLAHPYGTPTILSSYSGFTNSDAGSPNGGVGTCSGTGGANGWLCQHRWVAIAGMVGFRNNVGSAALTNWVSPQGSQIAFGRGTSLTLSPTTSSLIVFLVSCRCARLCGHQQRGLGLVHHLLEFSA